MFVGLVFVFINCSKVVIIGLRVVICVCSSVVVRSVVRSFFRDF